MSAVEELEVEEPRISKPAKVAMFAARREDLRLIKVPRYPVRDAGGRQVSESLGEAVQFRRGVLEVPTDGGLALEDGREIAGSDLIPWLEKHRLFGNREEGFFKVEVAAPAPSEEEMQALMNAAIALDEDKLQAIVVEEEAGWARDAILNVAREGVERIRAFKEQAAAESKDKQPAESSSAAKPKPSGGTQSKE